MAVFMVSPQFYSHPAVTLSSDAAIGLWVRSGSWMARHLTNGLVHHEIVDWWEARPQAAELVKHGLWRKTRGGWLMLAAVPAAPGCPPLRLWVIQRQESRPAIPAPVRLAVFLRDGYRCVECGDTHDLTLDHIFPWSRGGKDTVENLRVLCRPCNSRKGARV